MPVPQRSRRRGWITVLLFSLAAPAAVGAQPQPVPGTRITLEPPAGFIPGKRFTGFQREELLASIQVVEVQAPYREMEARLTPERFAEDRMVLRSSEPQPFGELPGRLLSVSQSVDGVAFDKWAVMFGDDAVTAIITATFPREHADSLSEPMRLAVLSARRGDAEADPRVGLGFEFDEGPRLRIATRLGNTVALNETGTLSNQGPGSPFLAIGSSISEVDLSDLAAFSALRLMQMPGVSDLSEGTGERLTLHGADAYEMVADAVHTGSGTPLRVYQVVIAEGNHYLLVQGYVGADRAAGFIPAFRAVARSLRRTR